MRSILFAAGLLLIAGCTTSPPSVPVKKAETSEARPILDTLRLTLDLRYLAGETLDLSTRVVLLSGQNPVSTTLNDCGMTPTNGYTRFTTGGLVQPGLSCHILVIPPGEPAQVFALEKPRTGSRLGDWSDWRKPATQIVSPMPVQMLIHKPEAQQTLSVPLPRQFEIRYQLTALNARDPKEN
jgi:hypothetical protein